jgi:hypothetical protein
MSSLEDMFDMAECVYTNGGFDMGRHLLQFNTEPVASSVTITSSKQARAGAVIVVTIELSITFPDYQVLEHARFDFSVDQVTFLYQ